MTRKEQKLEPGVKYHGMYWFNEFGEQFFEADQEGEKVVKPNNMKRVKQCDGFTIYQSKNLIEVRFTFPKTNDKVKLVQSLMTRVSAASVELSKYEFSV